MRAVIAILVLLGASGLAHASTDCTGTVPQALPLRPVIVPPLSPEFAAASTQLGAQRGVLSHAYDESQSVDQVLLRLRIEGCQNVAGAMSAPSALNPADPAAYKPKTAFDNTPYRFNMTQNGKRMTADDFDAWLKANGYSAGRRAQTTAPAATPAATETPPKPAVD